MKRLVALLLVLVFVCSAFPALAARDAPIGYYIRFLPTLITVGNDYIKVEGYFVGTYSCDEKYSCTFSCKFSYVDR